MAFHLRAELRSRARELDHYRLVTLTGPGGSGKTTLARAWCEERAEASGRSGWLSVRGIHDDPALFVADMIEAVRGALADPLDDGRPFGDDVQRVLHPGQRIAALSRSIERAFSTLGSPMLVCLDGLEALSTESASLEILDALVRMETSPVRWLVTTRGLEPASAPRLRAEGVALELGPEELQLRTDQVRAVLADAGVELDEDEIGRLLARTEGWPIAVRFATRALTDIDRSARDRVLRDLVQQRDLFRYIADELMGGIDPAVADVLKASSVLGPVDAETLALTGTDGPAWDAVESALRAGLLVEARGEVGVHDLLAEWIQLRWRTGEDEALGRRLGALLESRDRPLRALELYLETGHEEETAQLLGAHGHAWLNRGLYALTERALASLPEPLRTGTPALRAVAGLIECGRDPDRAIDHLVTAARAFAAAGDRAAHFATLHELAILAVNQNRLGDVRRHARGLLRFRDVVLEPRLRGMLAQFAANGSFARGRFRRALSFLDVADRFDHEPRERAGIGLLRSVIHFHRGEWDRVVDEVEARCADADQRLYGPGFFAMQNWRAAVLGLRGVEVDRCREVLAEGAALFEAAGHTLNLVYSEVVRGWIDAAAGDFESATRRFADATVVCQRLGTREIEAGAWGHLARAHQRAGRNDEARDAAGRSLAILEHPKSFARNMPQSSFWAPSAALAALVFAETGDAAHAREVLRSKRAALEHRELAPTRHAVALVMARIAALEGDDDALRTEIDRAREALASGPRLDPAPAVDEALRTWVESATAAPTSAERPKPLQLVQLRTLGGLSVQIDGRPIADRAWRGKVARRLFVRLLAAEGRPVPRERLEADLWPESTAESAGNSLRVALTRLRDALEPRRMRGATSRFVRVEGELVQLTEACLEGWDVSRLREGLEALATASRNADPVAARDALEAIEAIASEPYLPEHFDEWSLEQRRQIDEHWTRAGREAAGHWLDHEEPALAERIASRLVEIHRDDELAWRLLAEARSAQGDRSGALRTIEAAREALRSELELPLGDALEELARRLRRYGGG